MKTINLQLYLIFFLISGVAATAQAVDFSKNINAASYVGADRDVYFFKDLRYARYDIGPESLVSTNTIANGWPGLSSFWQTDIDAATYVGVDRDIYLFKQDKYLRYNLSTNTVSSETTIANGWPGLSSFWQSDLDAATYVGVGRDVYLFKQGRYLRYNISTDTVYGESTISNGWPGLSSFWESDLDAATYSGIGRDIYLFKQDRYLRYDLATETVKSTNTITNGWRALLSADAPDFDTSRWMTDLYPSIKHLKLNQILMTGSHNALYGRAAAGDYCYVQNNNIQTQFSFGGARYFDIRPYIYESQGSWNHFGAFHGGNFCEIKFFDLEADLIALKNSMAGSGNKKEIVIMHIKEMKIKTGSPSDIAKDTFMAMLRRVFGSTIITPAEVPNGLYEYSIEQLHAKGNVIFISEYEFTDQLYFYDQPRVGENKGKYLWYPFIADKDEDDVASGLQPYINQTISLPNNYFVAGASAAGAINLKGEAVVFNKYFYENKTSSWINANATWIHAMDYVGWDQGWSRKIAEQFYRENVIRGFLSSSSKSTATKVLNVEEDAILSSINLYPNPATDAFSFTVPTEFKQSKVNVSISDISGKIVQSTILQNNNTNNLSVKTNTLSNGLYFVKIDIGDTSVTKKILINK